MQNQYGKPTSINTPLPTSQALVADDEIDLYELFSVLWKGKWLILLITAMFSVGAVLFALSKPNIYNSSVLLAPSSEESGGMSGLASQFGGLASLAGVSLDSGSANTTDMALAILTSRKFLTSFVIRHDLKVALFAGTKWDAETKKLLLDKAIYDSEKRKWMRDVKPGKTAEPSDWEVYKLFKDMVKVSPNKENGLVTVGVEFLSPILAKQWVEWLILDLNKEMRETDSAEVDRNIEFLQSNLEKTNLANMRTVFYQLIEEQLKTKMLSQAQVEYAFKTIDPAVVAEEKSKPKRALICVLGTLLGGMFGVMLVLILHFIRKKEAE